MSQDRETATLCTEDLFLSTQYIHISLPAYQMVNYVGEVEVTDGQYHIFSGPSWVSHLPAGTHHGLHKGFLSRAFLYDYFVTRQDDKAIFSVPAETPSLPPLPPAIQPAPTCLKSTASVTEIGI